MKDDEQNRTSINRAPDPTKDSYIRSLESRLAAVEEFLGNLQLTVIERSERLKRSSEAESPLAERELAMLTKVINGTNDAVLLLDEQLHISSWNRAAEQKFGFSAKQALGQGLELLTSPDQLAGVIAICKHIAQTGEPAQLQFRPERNDVTDIVSINAFPIHDESGNVISIAVLGAETTRHQVLVTQANSDRYRIEAELRKARDEATAAAQVKSEFLANMSHEIRTPLNSIIGLSGLLLDTPLTAEQHEFVTDIQKSGDALLGLISNILDFSKMSTGKLVFEDVDFNLNDVIEEAVELEVQQARRKRLELTVEIDPEVPPRLRGDPGRLRQILLNLLSNAIKFTEHGEIDLAVSKISETPHEAALRFEVRDTGIGIAPDQQSGLFQPFTQVDASTTRHYGGTGLGLSIVRELIEAMNGTVSMTSKLGEGSTFWFTVKLARQMDNGRPVAERFVPMMGATVLIVDDNARSRQILETLLSSWGMRARSAASAEEGLALLRSAANEPYQIALLDVMMPGLDGIEMARQIQSVPALAEPAVIFISSVGARPEFAPRLVGLDNAAWLMKPILQSSLYREVVRVLTSADTKTASPDRSNPNRSPTFSRFELPAGVNPRVLLAEDNPLNQKVAKLQLAKIGLVVDVAGNGREAVETALRLHYDIIFMDCQMPELDGYEATRELRRRAPSEHSKIIAMTAHALPGDREKCLAAGMDAYISKPVTQDSLEAVLEELFPAHSSPQATDREAVISSGSPTTLPEISPTYRQSLATPLAEDALRPQPLPPPGAAQPSSPVHVEPEGAAIEISPIAGVGSSNGLAAKAEALSGQAAKDLGHVCDRATLEELRAEGDNLLPELIEMFQTELTKGLNELTHALATRDCSAVARIAHTLKGTAGTFGAMQMHEMAGRMDQAARAGEAEQAATMFEEFRLECERVRRYLAAEIKTSMVLAVDAENSEVSDR